MNVPAPIFSRLLVVEPPQYANGRAYISNEHRPYIVYGMSVVTNAPPVGLEVSPSGLNIAASPAVGFLTLVEWGTMIPRLSRVPLAALDRIRTQIQMSQLRSLGDPSCPARHH